MSELDIVVRLRQYAFPDPHDEREVLHAPILREAADEIERLRGALCDAADSLWDYAANRAARKAEAALLLGVKTPEVKT